MQAEWERYELCIIGMRVNVIDTLHKVFHWSLKQRCAMKHCRTDRNMIRHWSYRHVWHVAVFSLGPPTKHFFYWIISFNMTLSGYDMRTVWWFIVLFTAGSTSVVSCLTAANGGKHPIKRSVSPCVSFKCRHRPVFWPVKLSNSNNWDSLARMCQ